MTRHAQVALILVNNSGMGGTERRYGQVYAGLRRRGVPVSLVINESLLAGLIAAHILPPGEPAGLVLTERFGRIARRLEPGLGIGRISRALTFALRKLDYLLWCVSVGRYLLRHRLQAMHLVLGGAYLTLPLQLVGVAPPAMVSVVCPSLREMVGIDWAVPLYRRALRSARIVDVLTAAIREAVLREGVPAERLRLSAGSCVDVTRFHPGSAKRPWVVFAGRLIEEKNPLLFVEACALVASLLPAARFFVLGDGPLRAQVEEAVRRHGLESCTEIGWTGEVEAILSEAMVFASLQRMDNYPSQALLEAMACGTAVVATDVGLTRRLVDDSVGLLVKPTADAVGHAMVTLLSQPDRAAAMGSRARERVIQQHAMEAYLTYLEELYDDLGRRPADASHHG